jgi:PAS domain S-box-containing protein
MLVDAKHHNERVNAASIVTTLLSEFSAVTEYRLLQDSLPRRLAGLLKCRCVLFYQRIGDTLQFVAGSFDDTPGWSSALLRFARINPIDLHCDLPEACAWRKHTIVVAPASSPVPHALVAAPLLYRQRATGVLVAIRHQEGGQCDWIGDEVAVLEAVSGIVALLLENTRLLERDRERIHELALLNSISSQLHCSMYELRRLRTIVVQRTREIAAVDLCELVEPGKEVDQASWITPTLCEKLFRYFRGQSSFSPLIIERPGDPLHSFVQECLEQLPANIKTFFALPLFNGRENGKGSGLLRSSLRTHYDLTHEEPEVLGIVVGGYYHAWKLRRAEIVLLQVLAGQASAVFENASLVAEVLEARNEARKLLRQVLDDERLKALILESIPSGLVAVDGNGIVTMFNRAASAILGYHPCEVIGQPLHRFLDIKSFSRSHTLPENEQRAGTPQESDVPLYMKAMQGGTLVTVDRHGREVALDIDLLPLRDDSSTRIGVLVTFTDVTSVRQLEEEKRRLDRLASLGEMAANVAHEVRNPLASIKVSMQMLMDDMARGIKSSPADEDEALDWAQEAVSVVLKEVERLDSIVRDLLLFAKPRQLHRVKCNIIAISDRVLQLIQARCAEANVDVHRVYDRVPAIYVDEGQIEQVLLNIYINALQAMPDGGVLTVSCHVLTADQAISDSQLAASSATNREVYATAVRSYRCAAGEVSQSWLEISVSDTGSGIPPDQLERIFQPFFTTRAHGIGLGLAITRRLVEDHGGYIRAEGHFGYGATLSVRLPIVTHESNHQD